MPFSTYMPLPLPTDMQATCDRCDELFDQRYYSEHVYEDEMFCSWECWDETEREREGDLAFDLWNESR